MKKGAFALFCAAAFFAGCSNGSSGSGDGIYELTVIENPYNTSGVMLQGFSCSLYRIAMLPIILTSRAPQELQRFSVSSRLSSLKSLNFTFMSSCASSDCATFSVSESVTPFCPTITTGSSEWAAFSRTFLCLLVISIIL